jgi:hypothetical protein
MSNASNIKIGVTMIMESISVSIQQNINKWHCVQGHLFGRCLQLLSIILINW